jgi:predicted Rossmann-fold nucleotide-binding protein
MSTPRVVTSVAELRAVWPDGLGDVPFDVLRDELYTYDELTSVDLSNPDRAGATLDARMGAWFTASSPSVLRDTVIRSLHDATIEVALARFVRGRRIVGVMGGHAVERGAPAYRSAAILGRELARAGLVVATGGGPGVMEAANLGAWFAPFDDAGLETALETLARAPSYARDARAYEACALGIRRKWPQGGESLGVPTWVYLHEPTTGFATHIAKYFTNSLREDGLLAIACSGVVYTPGGAGTEQEIFADSAQNSLKLERVRSPLVFFGTAYFGEEHPELLAAVRRQAEGFGWGELVFLTDDPSAVVAFIEANDPDPHAIAGPDRRRTHAAH